MKDRKEHLKKYTLEYRKRPRSRAYASWRAMIERCTNQKANNYRNYGGRGIFVCERWYNFENFLFDMGIRPTGFSLDRIDNDGNYEPGNCRWASRYEQSINKRTTHFIEAFGQKKSLTEWVKITGISRSLIEYRLYKLNWDAERALTDKVSPISRSKFFLEAYGKRLPVVEWARLKNVNYQNLLRRYKRYIKGIITFEELLEKKMKNPNDVSPKTKRRLVIEVSERFHQDIKRRALMKNTTMKAYILETLIQHIKGTYESGIVQHNGHGKLSE